MNNLTSLLTPISYTPLSLTSVYVPPDNNNLNITGVDLNKLPKKSSNFKQFVGNIDSFLGKENILGTSNGLLISSGIDLVNGLIKPPPGYSGTKGNIQQGADLAWNTAADTIMKVPGWGTAIGVGMKGLGLLNRGIQRLGGGTDGMTTADALLNSNFLGWTPLGLINGFGGKKANSYTRNNELDTASLAGFSGFLQLLNTTQIGAGKKYGLFSSGARHKQNELTEYTQGVKHSISNIVDFNTLNNMASLGTTPFTMQLLNIDLSGGVLNLRAARSGMKLPKIKLPKFKLKFYDPFKATLGEDWEEMYDTDGVRTAIPSTLSTAQKQGLAPIPTKRGGIVYMKPDGSFSDVPLRTSLYAKDGIKLARNAVKKWQSGGTLTIVPKEVVNEEEALNYTANLYPFIQPYLTNVRVHNATSDPKFIEYANSLDTPVNIEFIDDEDTSYGIPTEKNYSNPYPGKKTIVFRNLNGDKLNNAVAMDLISHYGRVDPTYKELYNRAYNLLMANFSEPQMEAAYKLGKYLKDKKDNPYSAKLAKYNDEELADGVLDLSNENSEVNNLLLSFYMNTMDGIVRDLLSTDRETYHASPMDALREYATSPEIAQALGELVNYIKGESPLKLTYYNTNLFKDGGKVQYKSVKETSTGQDIGIPIKITDNQRNGIDPIKTNSGRLVIMHKDGTVIYVEAARLMKPYLKNGGQMNVIPEGALHARKNHLTEIDDMYKLVTHKGIPVITIEDDGEVIQHAEVEHSEIIFTKEVTDKMEEYRKLGTDEAAIKCGKMLVKEILYNTDDRSGVIKTVE